MERRPIRGYSVALCPQICGPPIMGRIPQQRRSINHFLLQGSLHERKIIGHNGCSCVPILVSTPEKYGWLLRRHCTPIGCAGGTAGSEWAVGGLKWKKGSSGGVGSPPTNELPKLPDCSMRLDSKDTLLCANCCSPLPDA